MNEMDKFLSKLESFLCTRETINQINPTIIIIAIGRTASKSNLNAAFELKGPVIS